MLSMIVTSLLLIVASCIVVSLLLSAKHTQRRLTTGSSITSTPSMLPASWYTRQRILLSFGFLLMIALTLFFQDSLTEGAIRTLNGGLNVSLLSYSQSSTVQLTGQTNQGQTNQGQATVSLPLSASTRVVRVDSAARNQYYNDYQWQVWSYSSCSGIAMETVMNAYGHHLIAADVLQEELNLGVWDVNLGLLREDGIATTAAYFGFNTDATHARTLQDVVAISNKGAPVIVSVRDSYYFPGGHIFVIRGGDGQYVSIADSSRANFQRMSYSMFLGMWQGFSAVLIPR